MHLHLVRARPRGETCQDGEAAWRVLNPSDAERPVRSSARACRLGSTFRLNPRGLLRWCRRSWIPFARRARVPEDQLATLPGSVALDQLAMPIIVYQRQGPASIHKYGWLAPLSMQTSRVPHSRCAISPPQTARVTALTLARWDVLRIRTGRDAQETGTQRKWDERMNTSPPHTQRRHAQNRKALSAA